MILIGVFTPADVSVSVAVREDVVGFGSRLIRTLWRPAEKVVVSGTAHVSEDERVALS